MQKSHTCEPLEKRIQLDSTVVFNEIMYHPAASAGTEQDLEWVELFNQMAIPMDISGWKLSGGADYTFENGTVIPGRGYLVVASNPAASGIAGAKGPFSGRLANEGEELQLLNRDGRLMNVVEYSDIGDWPTGADGSGFSLAKAELYSSAADAKNWTVSRQQAGTPGATNFPSGVPAASTLVFNEIAPASGSGFWLELTNTGSASINLGGYIIGSSASSSFTFANQTLAPGQLLLIDQNQLGFGSADGDKLYLYSAGKDQLLDARPVTTQVRGLASGQGSQWLYPASPTPGAANSFNLNSDIVINEVMYHAPDQQPTSPTYQTATLLGMTDFTPWRYSRPISGLAAGWAETAHSGSGWLSGPALLNQGASAAQLPFSIGTTVSGSVRRTTYFEREFTFSGNVNDVTSLLLSHVVDDGAVFYLNGVEVLRYNMPSGAISSDTLASSVISTATYVQSIAISKAALISGTNRLSVEVHQGSTSSSDMTFGAEVAVMTQTAPAGGPYTESGEEWIELHNRGTSPVNLSGWSLSDGIDFTFPAGTSIPAGGYLVVASNAAALASKYPGITIVGNFDKSLSNSTDRIVLLDANNNPADEVRYFDGGAWAGLADGGGSSLELRSPNADNSKPESWAASSEAGKASWNTFAVTLTAAADTGPVGVWNEFLFGLMQSGEVLLDDISVVENPRTTSARQLIQNQTFTNDALGAQPAKWRIIGNHQGTVVADPANASNKVLRLKATGVTTPQGNDAGTTLAGNTAIVNGRQYQVTFKARWVSGTPLLNSRGYLSRFAQTFVLPVPTQNGTPGAQNSTFVANAGPTYSNLKHSPVMPAPGQAVTVSVNATDPNGISDLMLFWSVDGGPWNSTAMLPAEGDKFAGTLTGQAAGTVVQFYVQGTDRSGVTSTYPAAGAQSRALFEVNDGKGPSTPIDSVRIVMLTAEYNHLFDDANVMSNQDVGASVIYNNSEIFYDVGARLKGSAYNRAVSPRWGSFQIEFNAEQLFRGVHDEISIDASGSNLLQDSQYEILVKQLMNSAGGSIPSNYDDLGYVITPNSSHTGTVIIQLARYNDVFLDENYVDGSDGNLYEFNFIGYSTTTTNGDVEGPKRTANPRRPTST